MEREEEEEEEEEGAHKEEGRGQKIHTLIPCTWSVLLAFAPLHFPGGLLPVKTKTRSLCPQKILYVRAVGHTELITPTFSPLVCDCSQNFMKLWREKSPCIILSCAFLINFGFLSNGTPEVMALKN